MANNLYFVFVFIFYPKNPYRMISNTSKKDILQKREREKERKHIKTLEQLMFDIWSITQCVTKW
jgi:hypothetical protein